ncbi:MAG: EamA family transporter RarD [Acidimicrobiia bacterium]
MHTPPRLGRRRPAGPPGKERAGVLAGVAAYSLWGVFPLVFHQLRSVGAFEILLHRIVWSFVVVLVLLALRRRRGWLALLRAEPHRVRLLAGAGLLIAFNWLVYIWAVNHDHVVEAALGYYINPLITVALGVLVLGERLRPPQYAALGLGAGSVAVLTAAYGRPPWVAMTLAVTFAAYGYLKKKVSAAAVEALAVETAVLVPVAAVGLLVIQAGGDGAFLHGSAGRDLLLVGLGIVTAVPLLLFGAASASGIPLSLLGLLQYLTPTFQLMCGVLVLGEPLPPERLAGFVLVWAALLVLAADALHTARRAGVSPLPVVEPA